MQIILKYAKNMKICSTKGTLGLCKISQSPLLANNQSNKLYGAVTETQFKQQ